MTPDDARLIDRLHAYIVEARDRSMIPDDFWTEVDRLAGDLGERALADDADAELREHYTTVLAVADEAGFAVPPEQP